MDESFEHCGWLVLHGGQSPILGGPILILGLDLVLEGAIVCNVAFLVAFETLLVTHGEGMDWFQAGHVFTPVWGIGGFGQSFECLFES
jgi:hypothetical protein